MSQPIDDRRRLELDMQRSAIAEAAQAAAGVPKNPLAADQRVRHVSAPIPSVTRAEQLINPTPVPAPATLTKSVAQIFAQFELDHGNLIAKLKKDLGL